LGSMSKPNFQNHLSVTGGVSLIAVTLDAYPQARREYTGNS